MTVRWATIKMPAGRTKNITVRWATIKMPAGRTKNMIVRWPSPAQKHDS